MKVSENLGTLFLGIWLIISALFSLASLHVPVVSNLLPLLGLTAGILILLGSIKITKSVGFILLGIWLILRGLMPFIYFNIPYMEYVVDILGIAAGILILLRR